MANKHYYFNNNTDNKGNHEVHTEDCSFLPSLNNRTYIGYHSDCFQALVNAKMKNPYKNFDGCFYCCKDCHTG